MPSREYYFYHPFKNSSFGFLIERKFSSDRLYGFEIDNIDLYYQPTQHYMIALIVFFVKLSIIIAGEIVCAKVLALLKNENSILKEVTRFWIWTLMISNPFALFFIATTDLIHPAYKVFGHWFCTLGWFCIDLSCNIIIGYSFVAAAMRYVFIFHRSTVQLHGKEKTKKWFLYLSIFLPLLAVLWQATEYIHSFSYINKCYGKDHKVFLVETSSLEVFKHRFWESNEYKLQGKHDLFVNMARRISKILRAIAVLVFGSNVLEGIFYYKILAHINR